jgi:hypothetical protein
VFFKHNKDQYYTFLIFLEGGSGILILGTSVQAHEEERVSFAHFYRSYPAFREFKRLKAARALAYGGAVG